MIAALVWICVSAADPKLLMRVGHTSAITQMSFSHDGRYLVSAGKDRSVRIWDVLLGENLHSIVAGQFEIDGVALAPNGVIAAPNENDLHYWLLDGARPEMTTTNPHKGPIRSVAFSPDGKWMATGGNSDVKIHDMPKRKGNFTLKTRHGITGHLQFSLSSEYLVSCDWSGDVRLHDVGRKKLFEVKASDKAVTECAVSPSGNLVAAATNTHLKLWGRDQTELLSQALPRRGTGLAFSPDGRSLYLSHNDRDVHVVDLTSKVEVGVFRGPGEPLTTIAVSDDGRYLAAASLYQNIFIWDVETGERLKALPGSGGGVQSLAASESGRFLAIGSTSGVARIWDLAEGKLLRSLSHDAAVDEVAMTHDGRLMAAAVSSERYRNPDPNAKMRGGVFIYDVSTGKLIKSIAARDADHVSYSRDGLLAVVENRQLVLYDAKWTRHRQKSPCGTAEGKLGAIAFSPDGRSLATSCDDGWLKVQAVNSTTGALTPGYQAYFEPVPGGSETYIANRGIRLGPLSFSADGSLLAVIMNHEIAVVDPAANRTVQRLRTGHDGAVFALAISEDRKTLYSGGTDATLRAFSIQTGQRTHLSNHPERAFYEQLLVRGQYLFVGSDDSSIVIKRAASMQEIVRLIGTGDAYAAVTPDNYYMGSKGGARLMAFQVGDAIYPFDQFDVRFNRPDIVLGRLGLSPPERVELFKRTYERRVRMTGAGDQSSLTDLHLPVLNVDTKALPIKTAERVLSVKIEAQDESGLKRLNVFVNDVPIYGAAGKDLRPAPPKPPARSKKKAKLPEPLPSPLALDETLPIPLARGRNRVQVSVTNERGAESLRQTFEVTLIAPAAKPTLYLLALGAAKFKDKTYDLTYAAKDAQDLATLFTSMKDRFAEVKTLVITDAALTKEKVLAAKAFLQQSKEDDEAIVFAATHGLVDDKLDYYLAMHDIDFAAPAGRGLAYEQLEGLFDGISSRRRLLLIDACHSGELDKETAVVVAAANPDASKVKARGFKRVVNKSGASVGLGSSFDLVRSYFSDVRRSTGAMVISSASGQEFAFESEAWKNGVFTFATLEGLRTGNADGNKDGTVRVSELRDYVVDRVNRLTDGKQTPTVRRENLDFDFSVDR